MRPDLISLGAGVLEGLIYSLLGVRSPAPPAITLLGLVGMLLGEQVIPVAKLLVSGRDAVAFLRTDCAEHVLRELPSNTKSTDS